MIDTPQCLEVFTYGTLRCGEPNHRLLDGLDFAVEPARAQGLSLYAARHRGFPYAVRTERDSTVLGDLITVTRADADEALDRLDFLEGYDRRDDTGHYLRRRWSVQVEAGHRQAWVYLAGPYAERHLLRENLIEDGDWRHFIRNRGARRVGSS